MTKHILIILCILQSLGCLGQKETNYKAFGFLPKHVPAYLYKAIDDAQTVTQRLTALDTIASIYLRTDGADSLAHYGIRMRQELSTIKTPTPYDLASYYYAGVGTQRQGLLDAAISHFLEGLSQSYTDTTAHQHLALGLAQTYLLKSQKKKTRAILDTLSPQVTVAQLKAQVEIVEGDYAYGDHAFAKAQQHYNNALIQSRSIAWLKQELIAQIGISRVYLEQDEIDQALTLFQSIKAKALNQSYYDLYTKATLYEGRIYSKRQNYQIAEVALSTAYVNTIQWNRKQLQQQVLRELAQLYKRKGDFKNAYHIITQYLALNNTIAREQNAKSVRDLEVRYETLQKEKQINNLEAAQQIKENEIDRQKTIKNAFLIGFLIILIPSISFLVVYYQKLQAQSTLNAQQELLKQQEVTALMQTQELELARASMNAQNKERHRIARELHDSIGGNLGAIKLQLTQNETSSTQRLLAQLDSTYEQVREISHSLIPKELSEHIYVEVIRHYIESFSKGQAFKVTFLSLKQQYLNKLDRDLQVSLFNIIKELLTNAYKHAKASEIEVQLNYDKKTNEIQLLYEDNGVGFNVSKNAKGIGLKNIEHRVKEYKGNLTIDTAPNRGTVISITLYNANSYLK